MKKFMSFLLTVAMLFSLAMPAVAAEENATVYFQNNWLWTDVYAYVHYTDGTENAAVPGAAMTHYENDGNYDVYSVTFPVSNIDYIVFSGIKNDGSGGRDCSPQIPASDLYRYATYYMLWNDGNTYGRTDGEGESLDNAAATSGPVVTGGTTGDVSASYTPTATITGIALIVDGEEYKEGCVNLTAANNVVMKVYGTNLQYGTERNAVECPDGIYLLSDGYIWEVSDDGTSATRSMSGMDFSDATTAYTLRYSNDHQSTWSDAAVSVLYSNSEDAAITGVSITVDGNTYTGGNVTIYRDSTVTVTATGSKLQNATLDHMVKLGGVENIWGVDPSTTADDGTYVTLECEASLFIGYENLQIQYCNDWLSDETWQDTGIYLTYNEDAKPDYYSITISKTVNGTVTASKSYAAEGETVTLTATPAEGYELARLGVTYMGGEGAILDAEIINNTFTMPASEVTVSAVFEKIPYTVTVVASENGTVTAEPATAGAGDTVRLTWEAAAGYELVNVEIMDAEGYLLYPEEYGLNWCTFVMPDSNVTVTGVFCEIPIVSAEITWGSLSFVYTDGEEGTEGSWSCQEDANKITVTNTGNTVITADAEYKEKDGYTEISGHFLQSMDSQEEIWYQVVELEGTVEFYLQLSGAPAKALDGAVIGTVTIQLIVGQPG